MVAYSFKERFIRPIEIGLGSVQLSWDPAPKMQTIRADRRRHARPGEELQLYYAMRTKQCRLIGRARCLDVTPIEINVRHPRLTINLDIDRDAFAQADGFIDIQDMHRFWRSEHGLGLFKGVLIRWEPLS